MFNDKKIEHKDVDMEELTARVNADPFRLRFHMMPKTGWMNDPNGLIQFGGRYHAFFQHYPYAPEWGPMHWAHVISDDLVHWEYLPIALRPDQPYESGCFSGSAVDNDGVLTLIYTAHNDNRSPKELQCIATSTDGVRFEKYRGNPVVSPPPGFGDDFRDPKVYRQNGRWHMVIGSGRGGKGCLLMFTSADLTHWDYEGVICESDGAHGNMWECPDLFRLDGTDVVLCSPMNMKDMKTMFMTGAMDYSSCRFTQERYYKADYGVEFYAPQTFEDDRGRRIMLGWMAAWHDECPTEKNGWNGAMTLPRELFLRDGLVCQLPVAEVATLRKEALYTGPLTLAQDAAGNLVALRGECADILYTIDAGASAAGRVELLLRCSGDFSQKTVLSYDFASRTLTVDRRRSGKGRNDIIAVPVKPVDGRVDIRVVVDTSSAEVFACGGRYAISGRIYPGGDCVHYDLVARGTAATLENVEIYPL